MVGPLGFGHGAVVWPCKCKVGGYKIRMTTEAKRLVELTRILPQEGVQEVLLFAERLLANASVRAGNGTAKAGKSWRRYLGGVNHGTLAAGIDDELYGRPVR